MKTNNFLEKIKSSKIPEKLGDIAGQALDGISEATGAVVNTLERWNDEAKIQQQQQQQQAAYQNKIQKSVYVQHDFAHAINGASLAREVKIVSAPSDLLFVPQLSLQEHLFTFQIDKTQQNFKIGNAGLAKICNTANMLINQQPYKLQQQGYNQYTVYYQFPILFSGYYVAGASENKTCIYVAIYANF